MTKTDYYGEKSSLEKRKTSLRLGLFVSFLLLLLFAIFTWSVTAYDVQSIGINGTAVGYASVNLYFHNLFPYDGASYSFTKLLGYFCVLLAGANVFTALINFIRSHGFSKMHKRYLITMFFYAAVVVCYIGFELAVINRRPENFESSYPSSHTMLALCVLFSEFVLLGYGSRRYSFMIIILRFLLVILMVCMSVFRLLSGVHWLTDIIGAVLLSLFLMCLYGTLVRYFDVKIDVKK